MAGDPATQIRREECRRQVLGHLSERQAVAKHPQDIRRALNAGFANDFALDEIEAALSFLVGSDLVKTVTEQFGATLYYQATTNGVLTHERGAAT